MEKVELQCGCARSIISLFGAEMLSYSPNGSNEWIWRGDERFWSGHAPILFPVTGRLPGDVVRICEREYPMQPHGFAKRKLFHVIWKKENSIMLELCADDETHASYPFDFSLRVCYTISSKGFEASVEVENRSDVTMPFNIGGHPAFACPMEKGKTMEDYLLVFSEQENGIAAAGCGKIVNGELKVTEFVENGRVLPLSRELFRKYETVELLHPVSKSVVLQDREGKKKLRFRFDAPVFCIWSKDVSGADYICLEPWFGMSACAWDTGDLETRAHVIRLKPGECFSFRYAAERMDEEYK